MLSVASDLDGMFFFFIFQNEVVCCFYKGGGNGDIYMEIKQGIIQYKYSRHTWQLYFFFFFLFFFCSASIMQITVWTWQSISHDEGMNV